MSNIENEIVKILKEYNGPLKKEYDLIFKKIHIIKKNKDILNEIVKKIDGIKVCKLKNDEILNDTLQNIFLNEKKGGKKRKRYSRKTKRRKYTKKGGGPIEIGSSKEKIADKIKDKKDKLETLIHKNQKINKELNKQIEFHNKIIKIMLKYLE